MLPSQGRGRRFEPGSPLLVMSYTKQQLKRFTLSHSLFSPVSLKEAIEKLKFVQIDPIRSPAPTQDLMLRHRVTNYHVGDISKQYELLGLEEDFFYAHGYLTREVWRLLHPRTSVDLSTFDKEVLETVRKIGEIHPKDLEKYFEKKRELNWWGGYSRSSKMALDRLHYYGLLRVVRREGSNRVYQAFSLDNEVLSLEERVSKLILVMVDIMAPVTSKTLSQSLHRIHHHFGNTKQIIKKLLDSGELSQQTIDGLTYLWPTEKLKDLKISQSVKFLSPFDPVVRDRFRFEHLFGWLYQFEAYVPSIKRIRGYYAMPLLWGEEMIGWANIKRVNKELNIDLGFTTSCPKSKEFDKELEEEVNRLKIFLANDTLEE